MALKRTEKKFNRLDVFLAGLVVLALAAIYFSFIRPVSFSGLIEREGISRYGEVDIVLPGELSWMQDVLPVGEEFRDVYGNLDWKILEVKTVSFSGSKWTQVTAKIKVTEEASGIVRYGKYTLVTGSKIFLLNDHYFIEGRIVASKMRDEKFLL